MKAVVLDSYTLTAGELSWKELEGLCDVEVYDITSPQDVLERAKEAEIILTNKVVLGKNELKMLPNCRYIGVLATGYNVVDVKDAKDRNIVVTNIPSYSADSVAQLVFAFILDFSFHVAQHSSEVHEGVWCKSRHFCYHSYPLHELNGKTLGIAGFGEIGSRVASIGSSFGMNVIFYNRSKKDESVCGKARQVTKGELLTSSDFLSLSLPLNDESRLFIDENAISMLKHNSYVINTGRGGLVDEHAMYRALKDGRIAGYATDVLTKEPPDSECPLLDSSAVITPHIAWQTYEARHRLMKQAIENIRAFMDGKPLNRVN